MLLLDRKNLPLSMHNSFLSEIVVDAQTLYNTVEPLLLIAILLKRFLSCFRVLYCY